jgi:hypothetical protein
MGRPSDPLDPQRTHSVDLASALRCPDRDDQHIGGTECGICSARIRAEILKSFVLLVGLLVGRPGLDPGTLGLKEGCIWSDSSGGVGIIRESKKPCPVVPDWSVG